MKELGWQVDVACKMDAAIPECDHSYDLPCDRNPFSGGIRNSIRILKQIISENDYDVVHCNTVTGSIIGRVAAQSFRKKGVKVLYTNHGLHFYEGAPISRWILGYPMEKMLAPYTDVFITINEADYRLVKKYLSNCGTVERIHGIGVDLSHFRNASLSVNRETIRASLGITSNDYVLTYVAEINTNKNQAALLEVFRIVQKVIPFSKLLLIGPDHTDGKFKKNICDKGMEKDVLLLGWRDDIPELLSSSDIYVASSRSEGLGLNLIEAMALGMPVITTDCSPGGARLLVQNNKNGILVNKGDYKAIANGIVKVFSSPEFKLSISQNALSITDTYSEDIISSKLLVGKSILPHEPLNRVSPENNIFSCSQYNDILPQVCPGVCIT